MQILGYILLASSIGALIFSCALSLRTPRCRWCQIPATVLADEIPETFPPVFQFVYVCPACEEVICKRLVNAAWD